MGNTQLKSSKIWKEALQFNQSVSISLVHLLKSKKLHNIVYAADILYK